MTVSGNFDDQVEVDVVKLKVGWFAVLENFSRFELVIKVCYTGRFATTVFSVTQRRNVAAMSQKCCELSRLTLQVH